MDYFKTYAAAGNACLAAEEAMYIKAAKLDALADEIYAFEALSPERWADALSDFAYWPSPMREGQHPEPALVRAIKALMWGDDAEFGATCREAIKERIREIAMDKAEQEISP